MIGAVGALPGRPRLLRHPWGAAVARFGNVPKPPAPADVEMLRPLVCLREPRGHLVTGRFSLLERPLAALLGEQEIGMNPIPIRVRHDLG